MAEPDDSGPTRPVGWGPREWLIAGVLAAVAGGIVGGIIGGDSNGTAWALLIASPGFAMIWIGMVAKAVEVGVRSAQD